MLKNHECACKEDSIKDRGFSVKKPSNDRCASSTCDRSGAHAASNKKHYKLYDDKHQEHTRVGRKKKAAGHSDTLASLEVDKRRKAVAENRSESSDKIHGSAEYGANDQKAHGAL